MTRVSAAFAFTALLVAVSLPLVGPSRAEPVGESTVELRARLADAPTPNRDPVSLARRFGFGESPDPTSAASVSGRGVFQVLDQATGRYRQIEAELVLVTEHAQWWVETGTDVELAAIEGSAQTFERRAIGVVEKVLGPLTAAALDPHGRVHVLNARIPGSGAYFSSVDVYPRWTHPYSNARPLLVMNVDAFRPGRSAYDETLSHELQHLVHWALNPADETWMDEGSAELVAAMMRGTPGKGSVFTRQPDRQLTAWAGDAGSLAAHYEAAYLFLQYFADRFGVESIRHVVQSGRGQDGVDAFLRDQGVEARFEDVFADWLVANLSSGAERRPAPYRYGEARPDAAILGHLGAGEELRETVHQFGADYAEVDPAVGTLQFQGDRGVRIAAAEGPDSERVWWANRADSMDSTLTRRVDLRDIDRATLRFRTWFDTERDYDFGYVAASTDGETWMPFSGQYTSSQNPTGNGYGSGYTGESGGGRQAVWLDEEMDLSAFSGQTLWLRFEYVTDQAYNASGWLVDGIAIPEIGFEDRDDSDDGWQANGFLRVALELPSQFLVQAISITDEDVVVQRYRVEGGEALTLPLDPARQGRLVIAISGTTPKTLVPSGYRLSATGAQ